ncbi:SseB family protein [Flavobacterium haoranii]|uniref:SseB protein N-terminal domain-containing protein n=1 Tax=Flavobacterium haoranii TaxID=683124 RepID=A0A1M6HD21_9FLAO|nr:SseB family protein [Flavobacterium haoranii]SHJ20054.1 SseB protein N-terminal domain-containing protein [Flavobacterium haoranii]
MSTSNPELEFQPNNTKLLSAIKTFQNNQNQETFLAVFNELQGNNAFLLIPTTEPIVGKDRNEEGWSTIEKGTQMSFTSVFEVDGQKILGAFTSQQTLMNWANETKPFASLPARDVLDIAMQNGIEKIVIDSNQDTMFVLGRTIAK